MTDSAPPQSAEPAQPNQQLQMVLDERDMKLSYCNAFRLHALPEEIVMDLGFNMPSTNQEGGGQRMVMKILQRVVLNQANALRLYNSLHQLLARTAGQQGSGGASSSSSA